MLIDKTVSVGGFVVGGLYRRRSTRGKGHMVVVGPCIEHQNCDKCVAYVECWSAEEGLRTEMGCAPTRLLRDYFVITKTEEKEE
ncbi:MAG: hypothetical protein E6R04_07640 [Spirochaetes bacterium]|nr:MAG: hypothetical protein E6R04_07640 [Spirochaetota bacterium]